MFKVILSYFFYHSTTYMNSILSLNFHIYTILLTFSLLTSLKNSFIFINVFTQLFTSSTFRLLYFTSSFTFIIRILYSVFLFFSLIFPLPYSFASSSLFFVYKDSMKCTVGGVGGVASDAIVMRLRRQVICSHLINFNYWD